MFICITQHLSNIQSSFYEKSWATSIKAELKKKGRLQKSMYCFWCPASIYLFELSNTNCKIKCEICLKLAIEVPDVVRKSLLLTLNIFDRLF